MVGIFTRDAGNKKALPITDYTLKPRGKKRDESSVSPEDRKGGGGESMTYMKNSTNLLSH